MTSPGSSLSASSVLAILKACTRAKDLHSGIRIHSQILAERPLLLHLRHDPYVANALINLYAKCGELGRARDVLDRLPRRNLVSWNSLLSGYVQHGRAMEALDCLGRMRNAGVSPDAVTFVCTLKACGSLGSWEKGEAIHGRVAEAGLLDKNVVVCNALIDMYCRCGELGRAREVFRGMRSRDEATWSTLVAGCARRSHGREALELCARMNLEGSPPSAAVSILAALKGCAAAGSARAGAEVHAKMVAAAEEEEEKEALGRSSVVVGSALVDMYAKCGAMRRARDAFNKLRARNAVTWNALIGGYVEQGQGERALRCFEKMKKKGAVAPDRVTYVCALKACGSIGACKKGKEIHDEIAREEKSSEEEEVVVGGGDGMVVVWNALVDMYARCGAVQEAEDVFCRRVRARGAVSWNVVIAGYAHCGCGEMAMEAFERMQCESMAPNEATFICALKACGAGSLLAKGKEAHARGISASIGREMPTATTTSPLGTALVDMYAKCGDLPAARGALDGLPVRNAISWNALLAGFASHEERFPGHAASCAEEMQCEGVAMDAASWNALIAGLARRQGCRDHAQAPVMQLLERMACPPDGITYATILRACGGAGAIQEGRRVHHMMLHEEEAEEEEEGERVGTSTLVSAALLDMYGKCGELEAAVRIFDGAEFKSAASWAAVIAACCRRDRFADALAYFDRMRADGVAAGTAALVPCLKAAAGAGALGKGEEIRAEIFASARPTDNLVVANALIDMYAKCGAPGRARRVFDQLRLHDAVSWSTLTASYAQLGDAAAAADLFGEMLARGSMPDSATLLALLKAFDHSGMLDDARTCFALMHTRCGIVPASEHRTCLLDLLGRAGRLDAVAEAIATIPAPDSLPPWLSLLAASQRCGDLELGRLAFEHAMELDELHAPAYVCMANIYATAASAAHSYPLGEPPGAQCLPP